MQYYYRESYFETISKIPGCTCRYYYYNVSISKVCEIKLDLILGSRRHPIRFARCARYYYIIIFIGALHCSAFIFHAACELYNPRRLCFNLECGIFVRALLSRAIKLIAESIIIGLTRKGGGYFIYVEK